MPPASADPGLFEKHEKNLKLLAEKYLKLFMRGYYRLFTIGVVALLLSIVAIFAVRQLWTAPIPAEEVAAGEVPDTNEDVEELRRTIDVAGKYRVYNAKLDDMVARGGMSPRVALDARRDMGIYDRTQDVWSDVNEYESAPDGGQIPTAFNPNVTLSGV